MERGDAGGIPAFASLHVRTSDTVAAVTGPAEEGRCKARLPVVGAGLFTPEESRRDAERDATGGDLDQGTARVAA